MEKKTLKRLLNGLFVALIFGLTFRLVFSGQELSEIFSDMREANPVWIGVGALLVFLHIAGESAVIHYMLRKLKQKTPFRRCLKYSFIGFFFCDITPSASGGQPVQMLYMKRDGIRYGYSTLIMMLITIAYKAVLVAAGGILLILRHETVTRYAGRMAWLLVLGFVLNISFILLLVLLVLRPERIRRIGLRLIGWFSAHRLMKQKTSERLTAKIHRICDTYTAGAAYIRQNPRVIVRIFLITVVQRLCQFAVTWVVYRAYGLNGVQFIDILTLQVMIGIAAEMLPLPGAAGITEGCFLLVFTNIFGQDLVRPALLLSRGLSYYLVLIAGGIVTLISHVRLSVRMRKTGEKNESVQS
ncbi:MAG: flippase-like domain-containing protein [Oscillospiraceae bacterium]|nr:flippase-like domain-containing protein [Oscillospiraceae bacterium]MCR4760736.1 flippase-like domain-containing protein [Oscillospiraceae bacterium]